MNPLDPNLKTGTIGELLVQIRLLQYVQAVATHKDNRALCAAPCSASTTRNAASALCRRRQMSLLIAIPQSCVSCGKSSSVQSKGRRSAL
jgi:Flp pilus assembly protein CpaB